MKKTSSVVWKFFDRIEENGRCVAVLCKLCDCQYKFFGNTTNLRVHLINKHPIQWENSENGTLDDSNSVSFHLVETVEDSPSKSSTPGKRRKYKTRAEKNNVRYSLSVEDLSVEVTPKVETQGVDVAQIIDSDVEDDAATLNLVRQMHGEQQSDEEWLDEDPYQITHIETYEPKPKQKRKYRKIKREAPSPTGLPGFYLAPKTDNIVYEEPSEKDEYSVFGEYVANKLRKVRTSRTRGNLQQLITTILWQAEYGLYDDADTVKRVLMMNLQPDTPDAPTEDAVDQKDSIPEPDHQSRDETKVQAN